MSYKRKSDADHNKNNNNGGKTTTKSKHASLQSLPNEIIIKLAGYLSEDGDWESLVSLFLINKRYYNLYKNADKSNRFASLKISLFFNGESTSTMVDFTQVNHVLLANYLMKDKMSEYKHKGDYLTLEADIKSGFTYYSQNIAETGFRYGAPLYVALQTFIRINDAVTTLIYSDDSIFADCVTATTNNPLITGILFLGNLYFGSKLWFENAYNPFRILDNHPGPFTADIESCRDQASDLHDKINLYNLAYCKDCFFAKNETLRKTKNMILETKAVKQNDASDLSNKPKRNMQM